jgi:hypothetical protein
MLSRLLFDLGKNCLTQKEERGKLYALNPPFKMLFTTSQVYILIFLNAQLVKERKSQNAAGNAI